MKKVDLPFFFDLAIRLREVAQLSDDSSVWDVALPLLRLQLPLGIVVTSYPISVSKTACIQLQSDAQSLVDTLTGRERTTYELDPIERFLLRSIKEKIQSFETILRAELETFAAYLVSPKGIYSISDLIDRAEEMLPEGVRQRLPDVAVRDIRECGRCWAFDVPTAAAFHIMRATETVMHEYYVFVCNPANREKLNNWQRYIDALNKTNDSDAKKVAALLQQIKNMDRNPIMHPELFLTEEDAFQLIEVAKSAIILMASKLPLPQQPVLESGTGSVAIASPNDV